MLPITNQIFIQILLPCFLNILLAGGVFSLFIGIGLIRRSDRMFNFFRNMNRWVSGRRATRAFEIPHDCWPIVLRYRYFLAVFITGGAVYAIFRLLTEIDINVAASVISRSFHLPTVYVSWLLESIWWLLLLGCTVSVIVGLMLAFFINALSKLETLSKIWISTRNNKFSRKISVPHNTMDRMVSTYPMTAGWIISILSMIEVTLITMHLY